MLLVFVLAMMAGAGPTPCVCLTPAEDAFQFGDFDFELDRSLPSKLSGWSMAIADFHSNPGSYPKKESERTECKLLDYVLNNSRIFLSESKVCLNIHVHCSSSVPQGLTRTVRTACTARVHHLGGVHGALARLPAAVYFDVALFLV